MTSRGSFIPKTFAMYASLVLSIIAALAPLLTIYAPLGMAPLLIAAASLLLIGGFFFRQPLALPGRTGLLIGAALLAWAAISLAWTINADGARNTLLQLCGILACAVFLSSGAAALDRKQAGWVTLALSAGLSGALLIYAVELAFHVPIRSLIYTIGADLEAMYSPFNRGLTIAVLLAPPCAVALRRRGHPYLAAFIVICTVGMISAYQGTSIFVATMLGTVAAFVVALRPRPLIRIAGAAIGAFVLLAPLIAASVLSPDAIERLGARMTNVSAVHRLEIWNFAASKIAERPLAGWGLDAARKIPGGKEQRPITILGPNGPYSRTVEALPLHTHNMALQWWLELGAVGALLGAALILWIFFRIADAALDRTEKALLTGQAVTAVAIASLSYGTWQAWWLSGLVLAAALSQMAAARPVEPR